jgi:glucokinase
MDFAPRDADEVDLWRFLQAHHGHVSTERVVSGPGLVNIHDFLKATGLEEPGWLAQRLDDTLDRAAVIAQAGMGREADICIQALEMFLPAYGAAAGNLALAALATGGLYIGGGIAPKLREKFPHSGFMTAFTDKGRFAGLLADIPVRIILEPDTALRGAGSLALKRCPVTRGLGV